MLKRLLHRKKQSPHNTPYDKLFEFHFKRLNTWMNPFEMYRCKKFQNLVLAPFVGVNQPYTVLVSEFQKDYFPVVVKGGGQIGRNFIRDEQEYDELLSEIINESHLKDHYLVQEFIDVEYGHNFRIVMNNAGRTELSFLLGGVFLYNFEDVVSEEDNKTWNSVALTGAGIDTPLSDDDVAALTGVGITPDIRGIPPKIDEILYDTKSPEGFNLAYYIVRFGESGLHGTDFIFGTSGSYMINGQSRNPNLHSITNPDFYFLEDNPGCSTKYFIGATLSDLEHTDGFVANERLHLYEGCSIQPGTNIKINPDSLLAYMDDDAHICTTCLPHFKTYFPAQFGRIKPIKE